MPPNDMVTELQTGERELDEREKNVLVAPGIYQSKKDFEANMAYDEMRDNEL